MRHATTTLEIAAPASHVWDVLVDVERWPEWGPSVRTASLDAPARHLEPGVTGTVTTPVGLTLPFRITDFEDGRHWAWTVAGVAATDHRVMPLGPDRCALRFGIAWPAAAYLAVCAVGMRRIAALATATPPTRGTPAPSAPAPAAARTPPT